jgi:glycosyltransferase involved in cell wall biosynthesis
MDAVTQHAVSTTGQALVADRTAVKTSILEITSYPPPRTGWGVRVQFLKRHLEAHGHRCVVLNTGPSRTIPSDEYETVLSGWNFVRKVWRFSRQGFVVHAHANGASTKGFVLTIVALMLNLASGQRPILTFHAGINQQYFPKPKSPQLWPVFWLIFSLPKAIICNSEDVKAKIVEYGIRPEKIHPIAAFSRQYLESSDGMLPADVEAFYRRFPHVVFCYTKIRPVFYPEVLLDGFARAAAQRPDVGLFLCGVGGFMEPELWARVQSRLAQPDLTDRVTLVPDLPHETFLHALGRARVCVRTHVSDGVCSSVLESLALGVPVVASENGTRPPGVITYPAEDATALARTLANTLDSREHIVASMPRPEIPDTLEQEARVITA